MKLIRLLAVLLLSSLLMVTGCSQKRDLPIQKQKFNELNTTETLFAEMITQLSKIPTSYSEESALRDDCFVGKAGKVSSDPSILQTFVDSVFSQQNAALTFVNYTKEGDPILISVVYKNDLSLFLAVRDSSRDRYGDKQTAYSDYHFTKLKITEAEGKDTLNLSLHDRQDTVASEEESLLLCSIPSESLKIPEAYLEQKKLDEQEEMIQKLDASVREKKNQLSNINLDPLTDFSIRSASQILSKSEGENTAYSPVSLYFALSMLAESTAEDTQAEILKALSLQDLSATRTQASSLYNALSFQNSFGTLSLGNFFWLNKNFPLESTVKNNIEKFYYGQMGEFDPEIQADRQKIADAITEKTNGKLKPDAFPLTSDDIAVLVNTIYFKDQWVQQFSPEQTIKGEFILSDQSKVSCDFMRNYTESLNYGEGPGFAKVSKNFQNGGKMSFILPSEGTSVSDLLKDQSKLKEALSAQYSPKAVRLELPKFDFQASLDLNEAVKNLGINLAFDPDQSNFSPLTDMHSVYISQINQQSAITVEEYGCEAAAFTSITIAANSLPVDVIELKIDRPFLFTIEGPSAAEGAQAPLLFVGIVENPLASESVQK